MSALGHKQTCALQNGMSALPPIADMCGANRDVRFVPEADIGALIRSPRRRAAAIARQVDAERLSGPQVDDQFVLDRRLDGKLAGLGTL